MQSGQVSTGLSSSFNSGVPLPQRPSHPPPPASQSMFTPPTSQPGPSLHNLNSAGPPQAMLQQGSNLNSSWPPPQGAPMRPQPMMGPGGAVPPWPGGPPLPSVGQWGPGGQPPPPHPGQYVQQPPRATPPPPMGMASPPMGTPLRPPQMGQPPMGGAGVGPPPAVRVQGPPPPPIAVQNNMTLQQGGVAASRPSELPMPFDGAGLMSHQVIQRGGASYNQLATPGSTGGSGLV